MSQRGFARDQNNRQIVLVLVGLVASGKSTFAKALERHLPHFVRCNQDELGDRRAVERLARDSLNAGLSVVIDRTNMDETQRAHWINIAREKPGTQAWCLVFDIPIHICEERLNYRFNHPTIKSAEQGSFILRRFAKEYVRPAAHEGFSHVFFIKPANQPSDYTKTELEALLSQIESAPPPAPSNQTQIRQFFGFDASHSATRGSGRGSARGGWYGGRGSRSGQTHQNIRASGNTTITHHLTTLSSSSSDRQNWRIHPDKMPATDESEPQRTPLLQGSNTSNLVIASESHPARGEGTVESPFEIE